LERREVKKEKEKKEEKNKTKRSKKHEITDISRPRTAHLRVQIAA
jgi:hypothetical protein